MKNQRLISFILVIIMISSLLCACTPDTGADTSTEAESKAQETETALPESQEDTRPETERESDESHTDPVTEKESEASATEQTEGSTETEPKETEPETEPKETEPETEPEDLSVRDPIEQRYFIYRIWNFNVLSIEEFKSIVDRVSQDGFNAIKIHIPWHNVEITPGVYNYSAFDPMLDYVIKEKGMKVAVSVDLTRTSGDRVLSTGDIMKDANGGLSMGGSGSADRMQISLHSPNALYKANQFYQNIVSHYEELYSDGILFYLPAFTQYAESEYWPTTAYDHSDYAVRAFREFLKENYGTIEALNAVIETDYASFDEVMPPSTVSSDNYGHIWYVFRHRALKSFIDMLGETQKDIAPNSKYALQFGSVWDSASVLRGTLGYVDLCENVDVLWVDDGPLTNHRFSMDYLLTSLPSHVEIAQEIDGPYHSVATPELYLAQGMQCFERGATYMSIANWHMNDDYERYSYAWREIADTWLGENVPKLILPTASSPVIKVSLLDLFRMRNISSIVSQYNFITENGEAVRIIVTDDLTDRLPMTATNGASYPGGYSKTQGECGWYYRSYLDGQFTDMTFNNEKGQWQGASAYTLLTPVYFHPDKHDAALVYKADRDGEISIRFSCNLASPSSDGVVFYMLFNGKSVDLGDGKTELYVSPEQTVDGTLTLTVKAGDEIAFIINKYNKNTYDSTSLSLLIEY